MAEEIKEHFSLLDKFLTNREKRLKEVRELKELCKARNKINGALECIKFEEDADRYLNKITGIEDMAKNRTMHGVIDGEVVKGIDAPKINIQVVDTANEEREKREQENKELKDVEY